MVRELLSQWNQERRAFLSLPEDWEIRAVVYNAVDWRGTWKSTFNKGEAERWVFSVEGTILRVPELVVKSLVPRE